MPMQRSESIANLTKAMAAARPKVGAIVKDKSAEIVGKNKDGGTTRYKYSYADLGSAIDAYVDALSAHGLALFQPVGGPRDGHLILTTLLAHESGEWISEEYPVPMFQRAQDQGSAITYARRYAVQSFLGLASEDDDGAAASKDDAPRASAKANGNGHGKPAATPQSPAPPPPGGPLTNDQRTDLLAMAHSAGIKSTELLAHCREILQRPLVSSADIGQDGYKAVMAALENKAIEKGKDEDVEAIFGPGVRG
jgi:hypothetical protein